MRFRFYAAGLIAAALACAAPARAAEQVVKLGWTNALYGAPKGRAAAGVVLLTGGDGRVGILEDGTVSNTRNWIIWTRDSWAKAGIAFVLVDQGGNVAEAVEILRRNGVKKTAIVGMSMGTVRALNGLPAKPDKLVLVSGKLNDVRYGVGSPAALPPTLIVHHREDGCIGTPPSAVEPFVAWSEGRAQAKWMSGGINEGHPCMPFGHHGHRGLEAQVVSAIAAFVKR